MQRSNDIIPLRITPDTGKLTPGGDGFKLPSPVCAEFVAV